MLNRGLRVFAKGNAVAKLFYSVFFSKTKNINLILGQVGITLNVDWYEPTIFNETSHVEASETKLQFFAGWFANPIFVNGKYPDIMRQKVKIIYFFLVQIFL